MTEIPIGYIFPVLLLAWCTWWAVMPLRIPRLFGSLSFYFGLVISELPFLALLWLIAINILALSEGDIHSFIGWAAFGIAILTVVGLVVIVQRSFQAIPAISQALDDGLGLDWRDTIHGKLVPRLRQGFRFVALLGPFFIRRWDVERIADISYGDAGVRNLLDVYRHRSRPANAPVLIHFHGGAMVRGKKNREALPLLYRLASQGWMCISANYRLSPAATFPAQLIDAKKVIAWVRAHGKEYGADTSAVFVAGGSAGAQLASQSALTPNDPKLQPGFESADTSVAAVIALYGYFGWMGGEFLQQIADSRKAIPPFFVLHGKQDTLLPVEGARHFVQELRGISRNPVVYAELPGAQHNFDLFHSVRNEAVVDGIETFAAWVRAKYGTQA